MGYIKSKCGGEDGGESGMKNSENSRPSVS